VETRVSWVAAPLRHDPACAWAKRRRRQDYADDAAADPLEHGEGAEGFVDAAATTVADESIVAGSAAAAATESAAAAAIGRDALVAKYPVLTTQQWGEHGNWRIFCTRDLPAQPTNALGDLFQYFVLY